MFLVDELLFPLDVLEHVFVFWHHHVVRKHLRVLLVEFKHSRQPFLYLIALICSLQVLGKVIKDQVVLEH